MPRVFFDAASSERRRSGRAARRHALALLLCVLMAGVAVWRGLHTPGAVAPTLSWCVSTATGTPSLPLPRSELPWCPDCLAAQWAGEPAMARLPPLVAPLAMLQIASGGPQHAASPFFPVRARGRDPPPSALV
ncbi:hypothetical protein GCM10007860_07140 [Chitiniphilus shinanonensis]|uniref:DUF2946 domain-containing protein n=1 Tax=Chitiniphilus shinanonensis TaxID=553088 RepID=A0ABQ6BPJ9_9NEIS|nr:hypothetical protein [Chitiniphilus shinanonensis]GLS03569.1 hypothetical protein GCM10007860_07140 [Chitiniphilus shinanonensis]